MTAEYPSIVPRSQKADLVTRRFEEIALTFSAAVRTSYPALVSAAALMIVNALKRGKKLLVFGNGGSAADAQHFCGELIVRFQANRRALPAIALGCDGVVMTACSNDLCYEDVFARQIEALGAADDIALGISTSGNSPNVVRALTAARRQGMRTILLTGPKTGNACEFADLVLAAPGANTARVQELHLASYHSICEFVDSEFSGEAK